MSPQLMINVAEICSATRALGPGLRAALWVQGCPLRCPGCISPDWLSFKESHLLSPEEVADHLLADPKVDGISLSGGEPTAQAPALAQLLRILRKRRELHILCFSGYRFETLLHRPPESGVADLLDLIDLLIDGPYLQSLNQGDTFAGSSNQRMIQLSDRALPGSGPWEIRRVEVRIRQGSILAVGVPPKGWPPTLFSSTAGLRPLGPVEVA